MTVLFCDVKGFVGVSEGMTPQGLVKVMNRYFSMMSAPIHEHGGIIDKYIGDAIMAYWGPPFTDDGDAGAVRRPGGARHAGAGCAVARRTCRNCWAAQLPITFDIRIGIATGEVLVGSIGSELMMSYTVMGDTVNLASRLEGANKEYGGRILTTEATVTAAGDALEVREIDRVALVGQSHAQAVFEIMGRSGALTADQIELRARFAAGLAAYRGASGRRHARRSTRRLRQVPTTDRRSPFSIASKSLPPRRRRWLGRFLASRTEVSEVPVSRRSRVLPRWPRGVARASQARLSEGARRSRSRRGGRVQAGWREDRRAVCSLRCRHRRASAAD